MASPFYTYEPFSSESSIRLFHLKKTRSVANEVEIELFETTEREQCDFCAVSYAWGGETPDRQILCNDQPFLVTATVLSILKRLQSENDGNALWIDSICINQVSIPERNGQVPKMSFIYREAQTVWVWLGDGTPETDATFEHLEECAYLIANAKNPVHLSKSRDRFREIVAQQRGYYDAVDTNFIVDILNLPWFSRTWTVQELVLGAHPVLLCGTYSLPWVSFLAALFVLQELDQLELAEWFVGSDSANKASFYDDTLCYRRLGNDLYDPSITDPVSSALALVRQKAASDPRDKVYGVYGIFGSELQGLPRVDYTKPVQIVFIETSRAVIEIEGSLSVLYHTCLQASIAGLPSWVSDWSNTAFVEPLQEERFDSTQKAHLEVTFDGGKLRLDGMIIDELDRIAVSTSSVSSSFRRGYNNRFADRNVEDRRASVIELVKTLQSWIKLSHCCAEYPTGEIPQMAFLRTILLDKALDMYPGILGSDSGVDDPFLGTRCYFVYRSRELHLQCIADLLDIATANISEGIAGIEELHKRVEGKKRYLQIKEDYKDMFGCSEEFNDWPEEIKIRLLLKVYSWEVALLQHDILLHTYQRTFFLTKHGYMGLGPRWCRPGDSVALIAGSEVPFIIRRNGSDHTLVGPAYVHGVMHGEMWQDEDLDTFTFV